MSVLLTPRNACWHTFNASNLRGGASRLEGSACVSSAYLATLSINSIWGGHATPRTISSSNKLNQNGHRGIRAKSLRPYALIPPCPSTLVPSYPSTLAPPYPCILITLHPYLIPLYPCTVIPRTLTPLYPYTLAPLHS